MTKQSKSPKPDNLPAKPRRFAKVPIRFLLPNIITLLAVCSGVTAIRLAAA